MNIHGSTALVTGASRRIGRALALALANNGCNVAIHYHHSEAEALETQTRVRELGVKAELVQADLANSNECDRLWKAAVDAMGVAPNILVNNASFFGRAASTRFQPTRSIMRWPSTSARPCCWHKQ